MVEFGGSAVSQCFRGWNYPVGNFCGVLGPGVHLVPQRTSHPAATMLQAVSCEALRPFTPPNANGVAAARCIEAMRTYAAGGEAKHRIQGAAQDSSTH